MTLSKKALMKYAEPGVRERLREIQRELDGLARDFPHLVKNADGSMPSVLPMVHTKKKKNAFAAMAPGHNGSSNGHGRSTDDRVRAVLAAHPGGITAQDIATAIGIGGANSSFRDRYLRPIARYVKGAGRTPGRWFLKGSSSNGHRTATRGTTPKRGSAWTARLKQRQKSADLLDKFDRSEPRRVNDRSVGSLVRRGYLTKEANGYLRSTKPFHVNPREARAS